MSKSTGSPTKRHIRNSTAVVKDKRRQAPGKTIKSREDQIIRLAYDLVEAKIRNKTATSQELIQFIKMGSTLALLEKAKIEKEYELLEAKTKSLESQKRVEELYEKAMKSFRTYSGQEDSDDQTY